MNVSPQRCLGTRQVRLGFLGVGWIGRNRMEAALAAGRAGPPLICDPSPDMARVACSLAPGAELVGSFEAMLDARPDGIVIATPSALHAEQMTRALDRGIAVFCQKPLGRNAAEVAAVIAAARRNDCLLGVDLSYRHTRAMQKVRQLLQDDAIGRVYAADLVFHNAYGPDKPWFYDATLSGGGCVMDLGIHLVDLLLWSLDFPAVTSTSADLYAAGSPLPDCGGPVEDYAVATIRLETGAVARIACSWKLHAGCDAVISATFHGTQGSIVFSNQNGSFYDFSARLHRGTQGETLVSPPDEWGGCAVVDWVSQLSSGRGYDAEGEKHLQVAAVLDEIMASRPRPRHSEDAPMARSSGVQKQNGVVHPR